MQEYMPNSGWKWSPVGEDLPDGEYNSIMYVSKENDKTKEKGAKKFITSRLGWSMLGLIKNSQVFETDFTDISLEVS